MLRGAALGGAGLAGARGGKTALLVKWLGCGGGYGHLSYSPIEWQPVPVDRWVACDFEKVPEEAR